MKGASRYLLRRLGFYLLAAWVALTMNFLIPRMMPGDPASIMLARFKGELTPDKMLALRETFGLTDAPMWQQYLSYLEHVLRGDLGTSVAYFPAPVSDIMATGLLWTTFLAGTSAVIAFLLGSFLGALAAWFRGGWLDSILPPALAFIGAFPYFWLAMLAAYYLGFQMGWFPVRHAFDPQLSPALTPMFIGSMVYHAFLPGLTLVIAGLGGWLLAMRNTMISVIGEEYVQYAHARGLHPRRVWFHYAVRNALLPNVAGFGMALGFVLSGALLTEIVFAYPGQGYLLIQAVQTQDYPLMQGLFLTITVAVLGASWIADVVTVLIDPQARS